MRKALIGKFIAITWLVLYTSQATAHEFWVAPMHYTVESGAKITSSLRVGKMMRGTELPYISSLFHSFEISTRSGTRDVEGIIGDIPAIALDSAETGLSVISYHAKPNELRYEDWDVFLKYLAREGLEEVAEEHRARELREKDFIELYSRYAKALIQVGPVGDEDRDRISGAPLELVALDNPYTPGQKSVRVTLLRHGEPVVGRQLSVHRNDGDVIRSTVVTDQQGQAEISISQGGAFLLNAVDIQPVEDEETFWHSYWASLTFGLPVRLPDAHPLDPLHKIEISRAIQVIGKSGLVNRDTRVALVTLAEPDKKTVLEWQPGSPAKRHAFAVVRNGEKVFEATVDLAAGKLTRWQRVPNVQPAISSAEWAKAEKLTKQDPRWIAAMRARGYEDYSKIFCESLSAGFFDLPEERGRRLLKMPCYDLENTTINIYGRPIEGLISIVDLNRGEVVQVIDESGAPVSASGHGFDAAAKGTTEPAMGSEVTAARDDWDFSIDGRLVTWQAWSFHLGFDQRFGTVLSLVRHKDGTRQRMVLYQGQISEIFVPYMDASKSWYFRSYMDVGEYGLGTLASPLTAGSDCPEGAVFIDANLTTPLGAPYTRQRAVCVFERETARPLWRHWEAFNGAYAGRKATELVVRSMPSVGNYDYVVDWVFTQKGELRVDLGATGIDAVKGVSVNSMNDAGAKDATKNGMLVAPNLVAVNHDHYVSLRLDIDVDGPINSFVRERLTPELLPPDNPRRSLWQLQPVSAPTEAGITARQGPELWRIENPSVETTLGHNPSYQIATGRSATSLLDKDDWPQRRAVFSGETLWVTSRKAGELYAGGAYPNQSSGGTGLTAYVDGESIVEADVVAWYTIGFHHLTRPEDWPVLPTIWHSVRLRPYGFFTANPGLGVTRNFTDND